MLKPVLLICLIVVGQAAPAELKISGDTNVAPYRLVRLKAEGVDAKAGVLWRVRPEDPKTKQEAIDWGSKRNAKNLEFVAPPGRYTVELLSGKNSADGLLELNATEVVVTIGAPGPTPPKPPEQPSEKLYFMIVRTDGPASPTFTSIVSLPGWDTLRKAGHQVKDFELTRARELGANIPGGSPLPCVVAIRDKKQVLSPDGTPLVVPLSMTSSEEIEKLPEEFK